MTGSADASKKAFVRRMRLPISAMVCLSGFISETGLYADAPARKAGSKPDNLHSETTLFGNVGGSDHARADRCYLKGFLGVAAQGDARSVVDRESDERRRDVVIANNAQIVAMRLHIKI